MKNGRFEYWVIVSAGIIMTVSGELVPAAIFLCAAAIICRLNILTDKAQGL